MFEIPTALVKLYAHWDKHANYKIDITTNDFDQQIYSEIIEFVNERMEIFAQKDSRKPPPWSRDPIFMQYRFCNIYRELDRQTIFFHKLLKPYKNDLAYWLLNMMFCRYICDPKTITKVGLIGFDRSRNQTVYEKLNQLASPKYGVAYIFPISSIQKTQFDTREKFFCFYLPAVASQIAGEIEMFKDISVIDALDRLIPIFKFNHRFHLTEVLIDLAYQYPAKIDLFKGFPIGPGSIPTMKRLDSSMVPEDVVIDLVHSKPKDLSYLTLKGNQIPLSAENWEGIGCEFRKYSNLREGRGRKRKYSPSTNPINSDNIHA